MSLSTKDEAVFTFALASLGAATGGAFPKVVAVTAFPLESVVVEFAYLLFRFFFVFPFLTSRIGILNHLYCSSFSNWMSFPATEVKAVVLKIWGYNDAKKKK